MNTQPSDQTPGVVSPKFYTPEIIEKMEKLHAIAIRKNEDLVFVHANSQCADVVEMAHHSSGLRSTFTEALDYMLDLYKDEKETAS